MARELQPIQRRAPLYEEVAERLRAWVEAEGFEPGDKLPPERQLAEILAVSRTSVRQGLTALRTMGLIEVRHGDGVYLRRSPADIRPEVARDLLTAQRTLPTIMETREGLETQITRLAAQRRRRSDIAALRAALATMQAAIDAGEPADAADQRFHAALATAARNPILEDLMRQLAEPIALTRRASLARPGRAAQSLAEHTRILDAILAGDDDAAGEAMRDHLANIAQIAREI